MNKIKPILSYDEFCSSFGFTNLTEAKTEKDKDKKYPFGCSMLYFDFPDMKILHEQIKKEDIFTEEGHGLEKETHVTLLYGLHDTVKDDDVLSSSVVGVESIQLHNASLFSNDKFDVLKFDAIGAFLHNINKELSKLPHTTDFPDYHPHCTIAYLKPGKGKEYVKLFADRRYEVYPIKVVYSKTDGSKKEIVF
jgi:hypothetical protein